MYRPINVIGGELLTGVQAVRDWLAGFDVETGPDGLTVVAPEQKHFEDVAMSDRLRDWLVGLRLLRNVPLAYLVPDAALLPPESIRCFHVDQNWVQRLIDGVFSAASAGTVASSFNVAMLQLVRDDLDKAVEAIAKAQHAQTTWKAATGTMTGMLIRSELVRRWPDLIVTAFTSAAATTVVPVLRAEPISRDVYVALFAGSPKLVQVREPHVGVRFGVEPVNDGPSVPPYKVDARKVDGTDHGGSVSILLRGDTASPAGGVKADRVIQVDKLAGGLAHLAVPGSAAPRYVALHLEQRPFVQQFAFETQEPKGSLPLPTDAQGNYQMTVGLSRNRVMRMHHLVARQRQLIDLHGDHD